MLVELKVMRSVSRAFSMCLTVARVVLQWLVRRTVFQFWTGVARPGI